MQRNNLGFFLGTLNFVQKIQFSLFYTCPTPPPLPPIDRHLLIPNPFSDKYILFDDLVCSIVEYFVVSWNILRARRASQITRDEYRHPTILLHTKSSNKLFIAQLVRTIFLADELYRYKFRGINELVSYFSVQ